MLTGEFTARRINRLQPRIAEKVKQQLDDMETQGAPIDLVSTFALPIPSLVICELLGVPYDDREGFRRRSDRQLDVSLPFAETYELEQPSRAPRLATWILKAAGGQALRDRNAKDAGADHDQQCDRNHPPRCRDGESSDSL